MDPPEHGGRPLPTLLDELFGEILLRLPPAEPQWLFRATLVCKPWRSLISDRTFRRRYREFHRAPPMLGFLCHLRGDAHFTPKTAFRAHYPDLPYSYLLDCRHGRALIDDRISSNRLHVWDPLTGERQYVRNSDNRWFYCKQAVLCATAGCDHLDCNGGPFLVAMVGIDGHDSDTGERGVHACIYSSESGEWSDVTHLQLDDDDNIVQYMASIVVGDTLYFECYNAVLRYEFGGNRGLSVIRRPDSYDNGTVLMLMEDGGLGLAGLDMFTLSACGR